jgi:hypothetical protein
MTKRISGSNKGDMDKPTAIFFGIVLFAVGSFVLYFDRSNYL